MIRRKNALIFSKDASQRATWDKKRRGRENGISPFLIGKNPEALRRITLTENVFSVKVVLRYSQNTACQPTG